MKYLIAIILLAMLAGCVPVESDPVTLTQGLVYTAAGDDGIFGDQADRAQIRIAMSIDSLENNWDDCRIVSDTTPWLAGVRDTIYFSAEITTGPAYYYAIKIADEKPNWSGLSNIVTVIYEDVTAPPAVGDLDAVN